MFGLFKRRRRKADASRDEHRAPSSTSPPSESSAAEPALRNWYGSSRELHEGLVVREDDPDVTLPAPLDTRDPPDEGHR